MDEFDGGLAGGASRAENFDFAFGSHGISPKKCGQVRENFQPEKP
jgi:hypothetical protein